MVIQSSEVLTDLSQVEETLTGLHTSATGNAGPNTAPVIRAVLANLVVYACGERDADEVSNTIADVTGSYPCRALIVQAGEPENSEGASVTAVCRVTDRSDRQLCGEIIRLRAPSGIDTTGLVLPLLIADVPVYLWAACEAVFENESFRNLIREADHVIVDSRRFRDVKAGLERAASLRRWECLTEDLGWHSLLTWREMVAQHFDPPVFRERLKRLTRIAIQFAAGPDTTFPPTNALLMAGWLTKRTGLAIDVVENAGNGGLRVRAKQDDRPVEVLLTPVESSIPPGSLVSVVIQASDDGETATFVTQSESADEVTASVECKGVCLPPQFLELPAVNDAVLLHEALDSTARDEIYYEALGAAEEIAAVIRG